VLGPSEAGLGGQDAPDGFPASGCNAYPSGANAFFADASQPLSWSRSPSNVLGSLILAFFVFPDPPVKAPMICCI